MLAILEVTESFEIRPDHSEKHGSCEGMKEIGSIFLKRKIRMHDAGDVPALPAYNFRVPVPEALWSLAGGASHRFPSHTDSPQQGGASTATTKEIVRHI